MSNGKEESPYKFVQKLKIMTQKISISLICFLISSSFLISQNYTDILNLGYTHNFDSKYEGFEEHFSQKGAWIHLNLPVNLNDSGDEFPYSPQKISVDSDVYLNENLVLFGKLGYEFARELFHIDFDENFIEESAYNVKIESGLLFEFGLAWRKYKS